MSYHRMPYHSQHPGWRNAQALDGPHIGIEFEVNSKSSSYITLLNLLPEFASGGPITEEDGSLSEGRGVEIIFPPVPYKELKKDTSVFAQCIDAINSNTEHNRNTGMHLNINTYHWPMGVKQMFCAVLNNIPGEYLSNLGGRPLNSYCYRLPNKPYGVYAERHGHCCAESKPGRIEVRFPQSTCDRNRIHLLVDFLEQVEIFCRRNYEKVHELYSETVNPRPDRISAPVWESSYYLHRRINTDYSPMVEKFETFMKAAKSRAAIFKVMKEGYDESAYTGKATDEAELFGSDVAVAAG